MGQEEREDGYFGAEEMGRLFRTVLEQPEPPVPWVGPQVRWAGVRLQRRRRWLVRAAVVAVTVVTA
ncbi:hypothetical protein ACFCX4_16060, partial [Kitasatospora sp. NPDC056327]|uniref:hypothetical protein n=1 Tax=Kitasatospora sp. NPDC056327 TaxID=3345785 RepID=UPI0035D9F1EA